MGRDKEQSTVIHKDSNTIGSLLFCTLNNNSSDDNSKKN